MSILLDGLDSMAYSEIIKGMIQNKSQQIKQMNQKEQVFLNSCQLLLEEFSTKHKGFIYFVWKKGKKHIQSLKYQCSDQLTPMKQTLSLSLKTYAINGVMQKRYTHFSLFDAEGRELQHIKLEVTEWKNQATQRKLTLGTCSLRIKVKRKVALQLQNFHRHSKTQIEQSSQQQDQEVNKSAKLQKKQELSIKEELAKAKREIEDFDYITSKLKNDRNFLIAENENMRNQLADIHDEYTDQITKLKNHYDTRIQIRQSIYEEQIQELITTFNSNYEINRALIEGLVLEKEDYEIEIQENKAQYKEYVEQQQTSFQKKIDQLQKQIDQIRGEKEDQLTKVSEKQNHISDLQKQIADLHQQINHLKAELAEQIDQHKINNEKWEKYFQERQKVIEEKENEVIKLSMYLGDKEYLLKQKNQEILSFQAEIEELSKRIVQKDEEQLKVESEKNNLIIEIEKYKYDILALTTEVKTLAENYQKNKEEDKRKYDDLNQIHNDLQKKMSETEFKFREDINNENNKLMALTQVKYDLTLEIEEHKNQINLLTQQIASYATQSEQHQENMKLLEQEMRKNNEATSMQYRDYNEQINELVYLKENVENELLAAKQQTGEVQKTCEIRIMALKQQQELQLEAKIRFYEAEIDFNRKQREMEGQSYQNMKKQYEQQLELLFKKQADDNAEIHKRFHDQIELKNKEYLDLKQTYALLNQTCEDLRTRLELAEEQRDAIIQKQTAYRRYGGQEDDLEIEEIQQESEQEEDDSESESESQSSEYNKKKKKTKKKGKEKKSKKEKEKNTKGKGKGKEKQSKKKKKVTSSESQSEPSEKSESQEEASQILGDFSEEDTFDKHMKNLAALDQKKGGSQKMIPVPGDEDEPGYTTKQPQRTVGEVISIPVPEFVQQDPKLAHEKRPPRADNRDERDRDYQRERDREYDRQRQRQQSRQGRDRKHQRSVSSKKKKKQQSSEEQKEDPSENSKVLKGKERVKELEKEIKQLKKQIKDYERNEVQHMAQIQEQEEEIKSLNAQMDNLIKKISKKDPKLARKISSEIDQKRQEKSVSNKSIAETSPMKVPPMPRKEVQKLKTDYDYLKRTTEEKNTAIAQLENEKNALIFKLQTAQNARAELQKKAGPQPGTVSYQIEEGLKKSMGELQSKYMSEKEKAQQIKLQLNKVTFEKEQMENESKKLRIKLQDQEEFIKRNQPTQSQKELQKELEEYNRQFLEMSKGLNSAKIEKEAAEEELRLMKKRYSEIIRASQEAETKAANLQRETEDLRRKENKSRRDIEDYLEEVRKYKDQVKTLQTDMNSLNTVQSQSFYERKKVMDEIIKLEDALSNKEFEVVKLNKEIDKLKHKLHDGDDLKLNKRNELLQEKERLDTLLIKAQKRIQELQEQDKLLKQRIDMLEQENKKGLEERKQTYGEKLRFYVEEISNIKQIVEEYQEENSRLKVQNSQFYEHNQILKISFEKLQVKYEQMVENEERLLQEMDMMQKEMNGLGQQISQNLLQAEANNITINNLRKELDTEQTVSKKKSDKLTAYEQLNEKYLYEIKTLKIKLSQFYTNLNQNELLAQKHQKNTKNIQQLEYQLQALQQEYNIVIATYTYKKEDVEQAMKQLKEHQQKIKQEEITRVIEELDSTHSQKQASMEQQIIELFNQNSKLRLSHQLKADQNTELRLRITELEKLPQKMQSLQRERDHLEKAFYETSEQLKTISEELRRAESKLNQSIRNQEGKQTENIILSKNCEDFDRKYKILSQSFNELKREQKRLNERLKLTQDEKSKTVDKLTNDIQHYQNKLLSLELEVTRLKQSETSSSKDYLKKIKKLQEKIQHMADTFKEHEETLEAHYLAEIKKLQNSIQRLSDELEHKMQRIEELNEALIMLQQQNQDLVSELTSARNQMSQENQTYTNDVNSLRNQLRQAENMYDANIKHLQEEMSTLSRELTVLRYNRQQAGSRLGGSAVQESSGSAKRLEEKVRMRDKRIEELKSQILTMEESLTKLMKKQTTTQSLSQAEIEKLRVSIGNYEGELYELRKKYELDSTGLNQTIKGLKREVMEWKNKNQQKELTLQQKQLEIQSIKVQLRTTKQLYLELQQQLQKRKTHLNNQMEEDSHLQAQIRLKNLKINELTQKLEQTTNEKLKLQTEIKRKTLEIKRLSDKTNELEINYREIHSNQQKKNTEIKSAKLLHRQTQDKTQKLTIQNKKLKNQMALSLKQNHQLKQELQYNTNSLIQAQQRLQTLKSTSNQNQHLAKKYNEINELIETEYQMSIEEFLNQGFWDEKLNSKDQDIQVLAEELEELRFLYDHKLLELDELKKGKYELELKTQDNEFVYRQLDELRQFCSKLEEEKKDAVFREEAMKLQLETLIDSEDRNNMTQKLQTILNSYYDQ